MYYCRAESLHSRRRQTVNEPPRQTARVFPRILSLLFISCLSINLALAGIFIASGSGLTATRADGLTVTGADGLTVTGADGLTITGADGTIYLANSLVVQQPTGLTATGVDGLTVTGADGLTITGADSRAIAHADGLTATGADGLTITGADGLTVTGADGRVFTISPTGLTITGADGLTVTGADVVTLTGLVGLVETGTEEALPPGLQSLDPELAILLNQLTDDSNVNAAVLYHRPPTEADLADLVRLGILGGTRYRALPIVTLTTTRAQLIAVSRLRAVRSIYSNRSLQNLADPGRGLTGVDRVRQDADLTARNAGLPVSGRGVTVAVIDTGLDGLHGDLAGRVVKNLKRASLPGVGVGFTYPVELGEVPNTDLVSGHGTFVAGVIAGGGARSAGKYTGVAPGAGLVGLSAGDLNLFFVLEAFDYLLARGAELGVRVVNCSFSANIVYDKHDPVNVATQLLTGRGINVVFSAGNTGPATNTLNPYAMAPWVISVGATDERGRLADFSSRGDPANPDSHPTLVAPGVNVISLRATSLGISGILGGSLANDLKYLSAAELLFYATASGTSFSAPQVAGTVALMLEVNPGLTPAQVRDILQRTATPLPAHYRHEVGAGMLNAYAAVLKAAFP